MTPFTAIFQYHRFFASPKCGGIGGRGVNYINVGKFAKGGPSQELTLDLYVDVFSKALGLAFILIVRFIIILKTKTETHSLQLS